MKLTGLLHSLGDPIRAPDEETYDLFAQNLPSHSLGFIDPKAPTLELTIAGRDLVIHQSPGVLSSNRAGGTTGAVMWKITPLFAEWISSRSRNPLFSHGILSGTSLVLELGCGVSGLVGLLLAPRIARYVLTDQAYVAKLVDQNIAENSNNNSGISTTTTKGNRPPPPWSKSGSKPKPRPPPSGRSPSAPPLPPPHPATGAGATTPARDGAARGRGADIRFVSLDWETDAPTGALTQSPSARSFDAVVACDCVYNEALIDPFVSACADVCGLRATAETGTETGLEEPCVCIVAQQLRDPEIFEAWLARFAESFEVWRVPDAMLLEGLRSNSGFVVHIGVLKAAVAAV